MLQLHYVDDSVEDVKFVERMLRSAVAIHLSSGATLQSLADRVLAQPIDCVLLDVRRPDSKSMADDVALVRAHVRAPVVFLTDTPVSDDMRLKAVEAGAEALLEKSSLSAEFIERVCKTAIIRQRTALDFLSSEDEPLFTVNGPDVQRLGAALAYIEYGLATIWNVAKDTGRSETTGLTSHMLETVQAVRAYFDEDLSASASTPLHDHLVRLYRHLRDIAQSKDVALDLRLERAWYPQVGSALMAQLGLQHLLEGIVRMCGKGDRVSVHVEKVPGGVELIIDLSRRLFSGRSELLKGRSDVVDGPMDARSSLQLGGLLLGLRPQQVALRNPLSGQQIRISL